MGPELGRERVLVRLPAWLGDFVMAEPALRALDECVAGGGGALSLAGRAGHLALLEGRFQRARRIASDAGDRAGEWRGHDVALLFSGSFRSAWTAFRARIPRRIGFARDGRGWLLTERATPARERGRTPLEIGRHGRGRRYLPRPLERSLAELVGWCGVFARDLCPRIEVRESWLAEARARRRSLGLAPGEAFVLVNVGAREGSAKAVPAELWTRAFEELARVVDLPLVSIAGPGEERALEAAARTARARVLPIAGPPVLLPELAASCAEARLVLTGDSGPRHLARAVGAPVVALAGPTDPRHTAGERTDERLVRVVVPCGPCHRERCPLREPAQHRCMREIAPQAIVQAALAVLRASSDRTSPAVHTGGA